MNLAVAAGCIPLATVTLAVTAFVVSWRAALSLDARDLEALAREGEGPRIAESKPGITSEPTQPRDEPRRTLTPANLRDPAFAG